MPIPQPDTTPQRDIYSVSRLNSEVRAVLGASFPLLWVEGEISNLARPSSGHIYFSLKDPHSQVRCAMFRMKRRHLRFEPENGMQVLVRARPNLYESRGDFQLTIEHMEAGGEGLLRQAFEELKMRLDQEGLFSSDRKQPLPGFPGQIGVITSPSGAAIRDVISVLRRRFPYIPVVIYPVQVQGDGAAHEISRALQLADLRSECDLLILTRGGGSLEDLMAFNDERVARSISACRIPVISAIGHEIDFTIADFVADRRAPTPSAAAELATPDRRELADRVRNLDRHLSNQLTRQQQALNLRMDNLRQRLNLLHPGVQLGQKQQRLDELEQRLAMGTQSSMQQHLVQTRNLASRLAARAPAQHITLLQHQTRELGRRMLSAVSNLHRLQEQRLATATGSMNALSPLATLERGYSITTRLPQGGVVDDAATLSAGDRVETRMARGKIRCVVESSE
jgi:exodeoxyribonuclease VII large subunit